MPDLIRVRFLRLQPGPGFHADAGEVRTMHRAEGEAMIASGQAELVTSASGSGARSATAEPTSKKTTPARKR